VIDWIKSGKSYQVAMMPYPYIEELFVKKMIDFKIDYFINKYFTDYFGEEKNVLNQIQKIETILTYSNTLLHQIPVGDSLFVNFNLGFTLILSFVGMIYLLFKVRKYNGECNIN
jgi:hypothetical protein